jgi:class 3 adenylate cyclase
VLEKGKTPRKGWLTFRLKIMLALIGVILLMAGILLFVLQRETAAQIDAAIHDAVEKSLSNFLELEKAWKEELGSVCGRYTNSPRILSALDEANEQGDPRVIAEAAEYETKLAALSGYLILFFDPHGQLATALANGQRETDLDPNPWPLQSIGKGETSFGYSLYKGRLYATHLESLDLFARKIGTIVIGFPLAESAIQHIVERVDGQLCFVVGSKAVASTPGVGGSDLHDAMVAAAGREEYRIITSSGQIWALFSQSLRPHKADEGFMVYAIPLLKTVEPFQRIRLILILATLATITAAVILGFFLSRGLSAPILELVKATEKVAHGKYDFQVRISARDEWRTLGDAFNNMVRDLFLKEKYRDVLDKAVSPEVAAEMLKGSLFLGGENRIVTTLFADIRGFAAMTEGMDPREVISLLNDYLEGAGAAIEAEQGVVDKYIGDQVMAIFGAPVFHADDAQRAVRAALRMQETIGDLNRSRRASGKPEISVGIGINTGLVVAGNMGSGNRLNYTVLGEPVNLAARLCSIARAGEILVSSSTLEAAGPDVDAQPMPTVSLKGLSNPVSISVVKGLKAMHKSGSMVRLAGFLLWTAAFLIPAQSSRAESLSLYPFKVANDSGSLQFKLSGRVILEGLFPGRDGAGLISEGSKFLSGKGSLFGDLYLGKHVFGTAEFRVDTGESPAPAALRGRLQQAFLRYQPWLDRNLHVQYGKFVSPFGAYNQRHDTPADPFIRPPLMYDYRTMVSSEFLPRTNNGFINWKYAPNIWRPRGAPIVWGNPYQVGIMSFGGYRNVDFRFAVMNSAPSSDPYMWDYQIGREIHPSYVVHVGYRPLPQIHVGVAYNTGPYLGERIQSQVPESRYNSYHQRTWEVEFLCERDGTQVRGEAFYEHWEVKNVLDKPRDISGYVEVKQKFLAGFYVALRYGTIRYNDIRLENGAREAWDFDIWRGQAAAGYRVSRNLEFRGEYMLNHTAGPRDPKDNLFSIQCRFDF